MPSALRLVTALTAIALVFAVSGAGASSASSARLRMATGSGRPPAHLTQGPARSAVLHEGAGVARWGDCEPIPYFINPAGAPAGWAGLVARTLRQASAATGYTFTYAGATTSRMAARSASASPAVQVRNAISFIWSDSRHAAYLPGEGAETLLDVRGNVIQSAAVVLNTSLLKDSRSWVVPQVLLHEVGHSMGLMHVNDNRQIMYPVQSYRIGAYQAGDLAGLRKVGVSGGPCVAHAAPVLP